MKIYKTRNEGAPGDFRYPVNDNGAGFVGAGQALVVDSTPEPQLMAATNVLTGFGGYSVARVPFGTDPAYGFQNFVPAIAPGAAMGTVAAGTTIHADVYLHNPGDLYEAELSQVTADTFAVTVATANTVTIATAIDATLAGGRVLITAGTGQGQYSRIASVAVGAPGVFTMVSNWDVVPDATSRISIIRPLLDANVILNASGQAVGQGLNTATDGLRIIMVEYKSKAAQRQKDYPLGQQNLYAPGSNLINLGVQGVQVFLIVNPTSSFVQ